VEKYQMQLSVVVKRKPVWPREIRALIHWDTAVRLVYPRTWFWTPCW